MAVVYDTGITLPHELHPLWIGAEVKVIGAYTGETTLPQLLQPATGAAMTLPVAIGATGATATSSTGATGATFVAASCANKEPLINNVQNAATKNFFILVPLKIVKPMDLQLDRPQAFENSTCRTQPKTPKSQSPESAGFVTRVQADKVPIPQTLLNRPRPVKAGFLPC